VNRSTVGLLAVLGASVLWGTTGTAAVFAPEVGPLAIGAAAMGVGGLLQGVVAVRSIGRSRARLRAELGPLLLGAVSVAVYPLAFYSSMRLGGVAVGTVVSLASAPVASAVLERRLEGTPLSRRWMVAVALGVLGSALLCLAQAQQPAGSASATVGSVLLGLVAGATYALYSWAAHRLMQRGTERAAAMGSVFGIGGLLLLPVLLVTGAPLLASGPSFAVGAYMAVVPMFLGYFLFGFGLARVLPSTATTLTLAEPALAAVLAVAVVGERMDVLGWFGLGLVGVALAVLTVPAAGWWRLAAATRPTRRTDPDAG
jgi:DME family drug/metabolite transporter